MAEDKEVTSEEGTEDTGDVPEVVLPVVPLFGKWDLTEVDVEDKTLEQHINLNAFQVPHTGGRHSKKRFGKRNLTVIERIINNLMRSEKYTGKKAQAYSVLKNSFLGCSVSDARGFSGKITMSFESGACVIVCKISFLSGVRNCKSSLILELLCSNLFIFSLSNRKSSLANDLP